MQAFCFYLCYVQLRPMLLKFRLRVKRKVTVA